MESILLEGTHPKQGVQTFRVEGPENVRKFLKIGVEDCLRSVVREGRRKGTIRDSKILGELYAFNHPDPRFQEFVSSTLYPLAEEILINKYQFRKEGDFWHYSP